MSDIGKRECRWCHAIYESNTAPFTECQPCQAKRKAIRARILAEESPERRHLVDQHCRGMVASRFTRSHIDLDRNDLEPDTTPSRTRMLNGSGAR